MHRYLILPYPVIVHLVIVVMEGSHCRAEGCSVGCEGVPSLLLALLCGLLWVVVDKVYKVYN